LKHFLDVDLARLGLGHLEAELMNLVAQMLPARLSQGNLLLNPQQFLLLAFFEQQPMVEHRLKVESEFLHGSAV
jgi:hypothetical protein